jgi:hypothetical protein
MRLFRLLRLLVLVGAELCGGCKELNSVGLLQYKSRGPPLNSEKTKPRQNT